LRPVSSITVKTWAHVSTLGASLAALTITAPEVRAEVPGSLGQAIVDGQPVVAPSPVMLLRGPTGLCSSTLVGKKLVVTARHCVAQLASGPFSCTPEGETTADGTVGGRMGDDWPANKLRFFLAQHAPESVDPSAVPDAIGARVLSTGARTACRDDLAFVVLDREIDTVPLATMRLDSETLLGERVRVLGYGLTDLSEGASLHEREDAEVLGVGAPAPGPLAGLAPVRALRISSVTCSGDSGGAILSHATGALVAVVSIGAWDQNHASDPYGPCMTNALLAASGPRLFAYPELVKLAFAAAGAMPTHEGLPERETDAGVDAPPPSRSNASGGCSVGPRRSSCALVTPWMLLMLARRLPRALNPRRRCRP